MAKKSNAETVVSDGSLTFTVRKTLNRSDVVRIVAHSFADGNLYGRPKSTAEMMRLIKAYVKEEGVPDEDDAVDEKHHADADAYVRVLLPHLS